MALTMIALLSEAQDIPTFGTTIIASSGLRGDIYLLPPGTESLPRFTHRRSVGTVYTTSLNIPPRAFTEGFPGITDRIEWFAINYTGRIWIEASGRYQFALNSDDGSKLYLDERLMINNDGVHASATCFALIDLERGIHSVRVAYFQGPRFQLSLTLAVAPPGRPLDIFDTRNFAAHDGTSPSANRAKPAHRFSGGKCEAF